MEGVFDSRAASNVCLRFLPALSKAYVETRTRWSRRHASTFCLYFQLTWEFATDRLLILNQQHLERILEVFIDHYNGHRPHRALSLTPPEATRPGPTPSGIR